MRIAVIGGGLSGCCAASVIAASRTLAAKCPALEVTVFESGRGLGGRASTRRLESGGRVDHGCQYISIKPPPASDHRFTSLVDRLERSGAVAEWKGHFCELHTSGTIEESDDAAKNKRRMVGVGGMNNASPRQSDYIARATSSLVHAERGACAASVGHLAIPQIWFDACKS